MCASEMSQSDLLAKEDAVLESIFVRTAGKLLAGDSFDPFLRLLI